MTTSLLSESTDWLEVPGEDDEAMAKTLRQRLDGRIAAGDFTDHNVLYIQKVSLALTKGKLKISEKRLEKLRRLCQLWDISLQPREITSHRKFVGPVIVFAKKIFARVLGVLMKDMIRQQKTFNAEAIGLLADLANEDD